jgi:hypothetical protein
MKVMKALQTTLIKQSTPRRRRKRKEKKEQRERTPKSEPEVQDPKGVTMLGK